MVMKALDFALEYNVHSMKLSSFLETVEKFKLEGFHTKAELIIKRITEIKKVNYLYSNRYSLMKSNQKMIRIIDQYLLMSD